MENTTFENVIEFFESSFCDKQEIPLSLELVWLKKAIGRYTIELQPLEYDEDLEEFGSALDIYVIDTLANFMYQSYQERQVSLVNKRVSIVGKDISIDGANGQKTAERLHLNYLKDRNDEMIENQKPSAYA